VEADAPAETYPKLENSIREAVRAFDADEGPVPVRLKALIQRLVVLERRG
jgi:hypothetical protein